MENELYFLPHDNFVIIENELLCSPAFLGLTATAKDVYLMLRSRAIAEKPKDARPGRGGRAFVKNNGELVLSYKELQHLLPARQGKKRVSSSTISAAFRSLEACGLIDVVVAGQGRMKIKSRYALSQRWRSYGKPSFQDVRVSRHVNRAGVRALKTARVTA